MVFSRIPWIFSSKTVQFLFNDSFESETEKAFYWISYIGSEKDAHEYEYTIELKHPLQTRVSFLIIDKERGFNNLLRNQARIQWTFPVHSARSTLPELRNDVENHLVCLPREQLQRYSSVDQYLRILLSFSRVNPPQ
jgi:hypothetical protein